MTAVRPSRPAPESRQTSPEPAPRRESGKATVAEIGGPKGPEPTRYGDWERNGRCSDF